MEGVSYEAGVARRARTGSASSSTSTTTTTSRSTARPSISFTEDRATRFEALGWHVQYVADANDLDALRAAIANAQAETARPSLIIVRSHIAFGAPHAVDTAKAHGSPLGEDEVARDEGGARLGSRQALLRPRRGVRAHERRRARHRARDASGSRRFARWSAGVPGDARATGTRAWAGRDRRVGAARVRGGRGDRDARRRQEGDAGVQATPCRR